MKAYFGNTELCNFDETYIALLHKPNANLDEAFRKLDAKYKTFNAQSNAYPHSN